VWRRARGVSYVPGDLAAAHLWLLCGSFLALCGGGAVALEWGLRDFQSYRDAVMAGRLDLETGPGRHPRAAWSDRSGRSTGAFRTACPRVLLEGEFVEWSRPARSAGFRDRHRVVAGRLSCAGAGSPSAGETLRFRPPSPTWEILRRYDRFLPFLRTERRDSPPLRVRGGSWRLFVMPAGYAFSE
jgi:hypothetical protein